MGGQILMSVVLVFGTTCENYVKASKDNQLYSRSKATANQIMDKMLLLKWL